MNMKKNQLDDIKVHVKIKLSALWASLVLCYIYGDYFGLYKPGKLTRMLEGIGPFGPVSQETLLAAAILLVVPSLMVFLSLVMPPSINRWVNIIISLFYIIVMILTMQGAWIFYIFLGCIEIAIGLLTIWYAWFWPKKSY